MNPDSHATMIKTESDVRGAIRDTETGPPSPAYRELARTADRELREWVRRRAERRAHSRRAHPGERTRFADGTPEPSD